ncbi:serine--tRNA ligase, partial [Bacillus sp. JJ722]
MLDLKYVRANFEEVKKNLQCRGEDLSSLDQFEELDRKRRELIIETEELKSRRNEVSQQISIMKREKQDADHVIKEMREVGDKIKVLDDELRGVEESLEKLMLSIPNIPHPSVPVGDSEDDNMVARTWGDIPQFNYEPKPHWDVADGLGILDFERAAKVTGSRFVFYKGLGARLERALISFMLDLHVEEHGYTEVMPPYMVNRSSMTGTGQLPKFEEDAFRIESD